MDAEERMSARYFDRQDGMWVESGEAPGVPDVYIPGLRSHHHMNAWTRAYPGEAWVYGCDECDAFAWRPVHA